MAWTVNVPVKGRVLGWLAGRIRPMPMGGWPGGMAPVGPIPCGGIGRPAGWVAGNDACRGWLAAGCVLGDGAGAGSDAVCVCSDAVKRSEGTGFSNAHAGTLQTSAIIATVAA